jgi:heptaprenyl diphosphate synthase
MGKSAALFALACHVGASEAKAPAPVAESLRRAGYNIGMAFQIIDDILDYSGDPEAVRKPLGNDIKEGLVTLPLICALPLDTSGSLRPLFSGAAFTVEDSGGIIRAVNEAGGVEASRAVAHRYTERALREIGGLPAGKARDALERLTRTLLIRDA